MRISLYMEKSLNYKDIILTPRMSHCTSRSLLDTSIEFAGRKWKLPVVPANMKTVIDFRSARQLALNNYFYILHRFYPYDKILDWIWQSQDIYISISVGVQEKDYQLIRNIKEQKLRVDCITVDIAHGFSHNLEFMVGFIKEQLPNTFIIGGNIAGDKNSVSCLESWGCNATKVGLS